jgi:hypothetical protein
VTSEWISTADTAKLIRIALRDAFPGVTFTVRSKTYAGGSSINVGWTDGPARRDVDDVIGGFAGRDFDGMIDLATYVDAVVDASGHIVGHKSPGTTGSRGTISPVDDPVPAGGRVVHFGAGYVFANRHVSAGIAARACALLARFGWDDPYRAGSSNYDRAVDVTLAHADDDAAISAFVA